MQLGRIAALLGIVLAALIVASGAQFNTNQLPNRTGIVHLFEWKWPDIAAECERYLGPNGFAGVQISPASENIVAAGRPWWERYQCISYRLHTRSGTEAQLADMLARCNRAGIRVYADILINHMTAVTAVANDTLRGTGGSSANPTMRDYPAVPYSQADFNPPCTITDYTNATLVRNCDLFGLLDLNQSRDWVRDRIVGYLDHLVGLGVAGFRVDAAKHMWPEDMAVIFGRVRDLSVEHGFATNARPFVVQEIIDLGAGEVVTRDEYTHLGAITEFRFSADIGRIFRRRAQRLHWLRTWGTQWGFLPSRLALVFVDNHDNQRGHGVGGANVLTHKEPRLYRMASAFMLGHSFGVARVMSSYRFEDTNAGPPQTAGEEIVSPVVSATDDQCDPAGGWVCEHRWPQIRRMVDFRREVHGTAVHNWWGNGGHQVAFCRGRHGFVAINNEESTEFDRMLWTCLSPGTYCDVMSGQVVDGRCSGLKVLVDVDGMARIVVALAAEDGVVVLHVGALSKLN